MNEWIWHWSSTKIYGNWNDRKKCIKMKSIKVYNNAFLKKKQYYDIIMMSLGKHE